MPLTREEIYEDLGFYADHDMRDIAADTAHNYARLVDDVERFLEHTEMLTCGDVETIQREVDRLAESVGYWGGSLRALAPRLTNEEEVAPCRS